MKPKYWSSHLKIVASIQQKLWLHNYNYVKVSSAYQSDYRKYSKCRKRKEEKNDLRGGGEKLGLAWRHDVEPGD